jgi:hypothetical protein
MTMKDRYLALAQHIDALRVQLAKLVAIVDGSARRHQRAPDGESTRESSGEREGSAALANADAFHRAHLRQLTMEQLLEQLLVDCGPDYGGLSREDYIAYLAQGLKEQGLCEGLTELAEQPERWAKFILTSVEYHLAAQRAEMEPIIASIKEMLSALPADIQEP